MTLQFEHVSPRQRVLFGNGNATEDLAAEAARLKTQNAMVISSRRYADVAETITQDAKVALHYHDVVEHVPAAAAEAARTAAASHNVDLLVAVGGGSAIGLAKAVALTTGLPIVAVPTGYAGSEATNVWGITADHRKTTGVDDRVLPASVIYDVELTLSLPVALSMASGLNAVAHCIDSLWAPRAHPVNAALATEGIRLLAGGLPAVKADPSSVVGREQMLSGAFLAATAFASAGAGMHHKICHVLGGAFNLPHAATHAVILPHVTAFNIPDAPDAKKRIAAELGSADASTGLAGLYSSIDAPRSLADLGFREDRIPEAVNLILPQIPPSNPRSVEAADLERLLRSAWKGNTP
ncbi:maleylacetate reductase [Pseudarthrobacter sp. lyk4-40-TYG-27]|uniref:maleylacetate reductase n=1 Tax=Pseudarthrobacter sp. lyk4-40-TYG-27 TaxID=3040305 RepID=UPI00255275DB|nr:maleylacetate reductase [Pseudarthrobacter sp. lyk4-40-TYG-27]